MATKEKASAAEVVKKLTKDNITSSGKAEESLEELQSANELAIKTSYFSLKNGMIFMSCYFIIVFILVLFFGLKTDEVRGRMATLAERDAHIVSKVSLKKILINKEIVKMNDFNDVDGKGILDVIKEKVSSTTIYKEIMQLHDDLIPLQEDAMGVKREIEESGVDTVFENGDRKFDKGAGEVVRSPLQAIYTHPFQSAFYGHGCHVPNCNFTLANVANQQPSNTIEECMEKCTQLRPTKLNDTVEYGFTYYSGMRNFTEVGRECYCKTTGGQVTLSPHTNATLTYEYVYYRFTWA